MQPRPLNERLKIELDVIRRDLFRAAEALEPEAWDWAPQADMKSFRKLLLEIGALELMNLRVLQGGGSDDWGEAEGEVARRAGETGLPLQTLTDLRAETLTWLAAADDEQLRTPIPIPESWAHAFGGVTALEPEELVREIARHEYYHFAQIVTYRWLRGHNPY
jgi:uncharacterized damage-inducible protein DinB